MSLRVGVVGVGRWGKNIAAALGRLVEFDLVAICDLVPRAFGVPCYPAFEQMLAAQDLKAVVIATPPDTHAPLARLALSRGVNVLVEKPMCTSVVQARELRSLLEVGPARLMVGHILLFHPAVRGIDRLREHGRLSGPVRVEVERWSQSTHGSERCPWWTLAPHDLALLDHWFGAPVRVSATRRGREDVLVELEYVGGHRARLSLRTDSAQKRRRVVFGAAHGKAVFDDLDSHKLVLHEGSRARPIVIASEAPLDEELRHFAHGLRTGTRFETGAEQGSNVVDVLDAGERSMQHAGAWVPCAAEIARYGS